MLHALLPSHVKFAQSGRQHLRNKDRTRKPDSEFTSL